MKPHSMNFVALMVLLAGFAGSVLSLNRVESVRGRHATLEEVLYIPSGTALKRMSLGYSGVLADVYWTRAVQYYGRKLTEVRENQEPNPEPPRYDLLYPLLDITTDLDPHLMVAYEFGSVFLSQAPPEGAGQPDKAVALVEKGIRANPDYWRLYFTLGFIHYEDRKDYKAAEQAFAKGSENPKALEWMKTLAATMAARANDPATAIDIWKHVAETTEDSAVRQSAAEHIDSIRVDQAVSQLERQVLAFLQRTGSLPASWQDLIRERLLPGFPLDSTGKPFKLMPDGSVRVEDPSSFPFATRGLPPGWKKFPRLH